MCCTRVVYRVPYRRRAGVRKEYRKTSVAVAAAAKGACSRARRGSESGAALAPIPRRVRTVGDGGEFEEERRRDGRRRDGQSE